MVDVECLAQRHFVLLVDVPVQPGLGFVQFLTKTLVKRDFRQRLRLRSHLVVKLLQLLQYFFNMLRILVLGVTRPRLLNSFPPAFFQQNCSSVKLLTNQQSLVHQNWHMSLHVI